MRTAAVLLLATALTAAAESAGGDDWLGSDHDKKALDAAEQGKPVDTGEKLAGEIRQIAGTTWTEVKVTAGDVKARAEWSADGKTLWVLQANGRLRRIDRDTLVEERLVDLRKESLCVRRTKEGLAVRIKSPSELWLLDEKSLMLIRKVPLAQDNDSYYSTGVAVSPAQSVAFERTPYLCRVMDLKNGKLLKEIASECFSVEPGVKGIGGFNSLATSLDGRFLFVRTSSGLCRFKAKESDIELDQYLPNSKPKGFFFSPDGKYVAVGADDCDQAPAGHEKVKNSGWYVYKVENLLRPVMTISECDLPPGLMFLQATKNIVTFSRKNEIQIRDAQGVVVKALKNGDGETYLNASASPAGGKLMVSTYEKVWLVDTAP